MTPSYELLKQADWTLDQCGGRVLPDGSVAVDFPNGLVYNSNNPGGQVTVGTLTNPYDTAFYVRSLSIDQDLNSYGRIQWPDGKYMSNQQLSLEGVAWFGPLKRLITKEVAIAPGELITVITNPTPTQSSSTSTNTSMLFGGVLRYLLRGGQRVPIVGRDLAERYERTPNGNILAPERLLDSVFNEIPAGARRTPYALQSLSTSAITIASPGGNGTIEVPVSQSFDFFARRFTFEVTFDGGVTGESYVKARDGSGYSLHSDYAPITQVIDAPLGKAWCIKAGVSMFFDFALRNGSGMGNLNINAVNVIGARQKAGL